MKNESRFNRVLSLLGLFLAIGVVAYGFLSLTNWSPNLGQWTGFSRFLLGAIGIIFLFKLMDEL